MQKKSGIRTEFSEDELRRIWSRQKLFLNKLKIGKLPVLMLLVLVLASVLQYFYKESFWAKYYKNNYTEIASTHRISNLQLATDAFISYGTSFTQSSEPEKINFNIKFGDWEAIKAGRSEMLHNLRDVFAEPYRKVVVDWRGEKAAGKIRLKGIGNDHRSDDKKWSFELKLKKDKYVMGMSAFAIHNPATRKFWSECTFMKSLEMSGIITPTCDQVEVFINGDRLGIMTLTERMSKEMLERQGRKEGIIAKLGYTDIWKRLGKRGQARIPDQKEKQEFNKGLERVVLNKLVSPIDYYNKKSIAKNEALQTQQAIATQLFNAVLDARLAPSDVFDVEQTAAALATVFFWGDFHAFQIHNFRFYFNPITFRFEPILTDGAAVGSDLVQTPNFIGGVIGVYDMLHLLTSDDKIRSSFSQKVVEYGADVQHGKVFGEVFHEYHRDQLSKLREDYPLLPSLSESAFMRRLKNHKDDIINDTFFKKMTGRPNTDILNIPKDFEVLNPVHVLLINEPGQTYIQFINSLPQDVDIRSIELMVNGIKRPLEEFSQNSARDALPLLVPPTYAGYDPHTGRRIGELKLQLSGLAVEDDVSVSGTLSPNTQDRIYNFESKKYFSSAHSNPVAPTNINNILDKNNFLKLSKDGNNLIVQSGRWKVNEFIKPPQGLGIIIEPGTVLQFEPKAGMLVRGHLKLQGTPNSPVILKAAKPLQGWAGLTIMNANHWAGAGRSELEHVAIYDTSEASFQAWTLTGAINFYRSDVNLTNVMFGRTTAEDALNIIHSEFVMNQVQISDTRSDGFDADFATGAIAGSKFINIGGDGIDFSGSTINLSDSYFDNVHDKAISAGEATQLNAANVFAENSGTGIVSKDGSNVEIEDSIFERIEYSSLMAYSKKPQYGGAVLEAINVKFTESPLAIVAQKKSKITIDGTRIFGRKINIDKLYKDGYMKK